MNPDHVEFMMGHKTKTYNDVASLDPEILRAEVANAEFGIDERPKDTLGIVKDLNALVKKWGPDLFNKSVQHFNSSFTEPHRMITTSLEAEEMKLLQNLAMAVRKDVLHELGQPNQRHFQPTPASFDASIESPPGYQHLH
jgi:hypothetical protein